MKTINAKETVYNIVNANPDVKDIMVELGFKDIAKPMALKTVGKVVTLEKGSAIKDIPMDKIKEVFASHGYTVVDGEEEESEDEGDSADDEPDDEPKPADAFTPEERDEMLKSYITRLSSGEDLESVRKDFVKNFSNVSANEIAKAEQDMIEGGVAIEDVQQLCDVHSALFHGATQEEKIANAEAAVEKGFQDEIAAKTKELVEEPGHPLNILTAENKEISKDIQIAKKYYQTGNKENLLETLTELKAINGHYGKKGELIYPPLKNKYGISGPSDVMWGVDDEIKESLSAIVKDYDKHEEEVLPTLTRMDEMIYKEQNILFPLCVQNFTDEDWNNVYVDIPAYPYCLITDVPEWKNAKARKSATEITEGKVKLPTGELTAEQLRAILNTIPMEITFIDENEINRYFNEGEKLFPRPTSCLGRVLYECHPKRVEPMVRKLISDFHSGKKDQMVIPMKKNGKKVNVMYMAVRDENGKYIGTMELVQEK